MKTRLERHFDVSAVEDLKVTVASDRLVGGPNLAVRAFVARLVDELKLSCGQFYSLDATQRSRPAHESTSSSSISSGSAAALSTFATACCDSHWWLCWKRGGGMPYGAEDSVGL